MKNLENLKAITKLKKYLTQQKSLKARQPKNLKRILTSSTFLENITQGVTKCNNKWCKICDIIIEGKFSTFKNSETKFKINEDLNGNSKNVIYITECSKCKEIYRGSTQAFNTRTSLHRSNIKITENRNLNVSKHLHECSWGEFKIMPIYQTNNYMLVQIKVQKFIDKFKPKLNKTWIMHTHKWKQTYIDMYIYIHTQIISKKK